MTGRLVEYVAQSLQLVMGAVFLTAAVTKLRRPAAFVVAVRGYELIPRAWTRVSAVGLIATETLVGVSLATGWALDVGVLTAGVLLIGFAAAVGINIRRGRLVSCGCFGSAGEQISRRTLLRIGMLLATTVALVVLRRGWEPAPLRVAHAVEQGAAGVERLLVAGALATFLFVVGSCLYHLSEIRELLRRLPSQV